MCELIEKKNAERQMATSAERVSRGKDGSVLFDTSSIQDYKDNQGIHNLILEL